jgi:hypothetical protein
MGQLRRHVRLNDGQLRLFDRHEVIAPSLCVRFDAFPSNLDELAHDRYRFGLINFHAVVDFSLLDCRLDGTDASKLLLVLALHGCFHVGRQQRLDARWCRRSRGVGGRLRTQRGCFASPSGHNVQTRLHKGVCTDGNERKNEKQPHFSITVPIPHGRLDGEMVRH